MKKVLGLILGFLVIATAITAQEVKLAGGTFKMGSPTTEANRFDDEKQHVVKVNSFYIMQHPVTQLEFVTLMKYNPSKFSGNNLPVESVSWFNAIEYANKLSESQGLQPAYTISRDSVIWDRSANGYRLPTEAEWEYAARAGTNTAYSWGDIADPSKANYNNNIGQTTTVDTYVTSTWCLSDMLGNVEEWVWDWYHKDYTTAPRYDDNPIGHPTGTARVRRGGSWADTPIYVRSSFRNYSNPSEAKNTVGFRLVRNAS